MGLETTFDYIDELNPDWPLPTDPKSEGDDHLRGIKLALQGNVRGNSSSTSLRVGADDVLTVLEGSTTHNRPAAGSVALALAVAAVNKAVLLGDTGLVQLRAPVEGDQLALWTNGPVAGEVAALQCVADGGIQMNYRGAPVLVVQQRGINVRRVTGETVSEIFLQDGAGGTQGSLTSQSAGLILRNHTASQVVQLRGNRAAVDELMAQFAPVTGFALMFQGLVSLEQQAAGSLRQRSFATETTAYVMSDSVGVTRFSMLAASSGAVELRAAGDISLTRGGSAPGIVLTATDAVYYAAGVERMRLLATPQINSSLQIRDLAGQARPVGFNVLIRKDVSGSLTLDTTHMGAMMLVLALATLTVPVDIGGSGEVITFINQHSAAITIAQGAGFGLTWFSGGATLSGNRQLASGSVASLWFVNSTTAYIWGNGLS